MPHHLQEERALPDAGFSPDEDHGARYDPTPENPVELPDPGVHPAPALDDGYLAKGQRPTSDPALLPRRPLRKTDDLLALAHLLDEGAPLPAIRATPEPFGLGVPAVGASIVSLGSHTPIVLDRRKSTANSRSRGSFHSISC